VLVVVHIVGLEEAGIVRCCDYVSEHSSAESDGVLHTLLWGANLRVRAETH